MDERTREVIDIFELFLAGLALKCDTYNYPGFKEKPNEGALRVLDLSASFEKDKKNYFFEVNLFINKERFERLRIDASIKPKVFTEAELYMRLQDFGQVTFFEDIGSISVVTIVSVESPESFSKVLDILLEGYN